jgi:DNA-binding beta-propeller fold protein YncE
MAMTATSLEFQVIDNWQQAPPDQFSHKDVAAVGVDSHDRVYLHTRHGDRVLIYGRDGTFISSWGDGVFGNAHGITIGPDDAVYCVDNQQHVVRKFTPDGELLMTLGTPGQASDTGYNPRRPNPQVHHNETVERAAGPFNSCTNVAVAPNGDLYVADGYGNARVHRFDAGGTLLQSWGEPGAGPGQFHLPHGIWVDANGRVLVADRENDRIQFFSPEGEYLDSWTDVQRPCAVTVDRDGLVYVAELWRPVEPGQGSFVHGPATEDLPGRVTVFYPDGTIAARWGASTTDRCAPGNFIAPHGICLDSHGDLYVSEVTYTFGVRPNRVGEECAAHQIQKFKRNGER